MSKIENFVAFIVTILYPCICLGMVGFSVWKKYYWLIAIIAFLAWLGFGKWNEYRKKLMA